MAPIDDGLGRRTLHWLQGSWFVTEPLTDDRPRARANLAKLYRGNTLFNFKRTSHYICDCAILRYTKNRWYRAPRIYNSYISSTSLMHLKSKLIASHPDEWGHVKWAFIRIFTSMVRPRKLIIFWPTRWDRGNVFLLSTTLSIRSAMRRAGCDACGLYFINEME